MYEYIGYYSVHKCSKLILTKVYFIHIMNRRSVLRCAEQGLIYLRSRTFKQQQQSHTIEAIIRMSIKQQNLHFACGNNLHD